jgi:hypothetical protein
MSLFVRLTVVIALALVALFVLGFVIKVLFVAALVAAVVVGVVVVANAFRRRRLRGRAQVMTISARR